MKSEGTGIGCVQTAKFDVYRRQITHCDFMCAWKQACSSKLKNSSRINPDYEVLFPNIEGRHPKRVNTI